MARPPKPIAINFPKNATPGAKPGEGFGNLVNGFYEPIVDGDNVEDSWRRSAGLDAFANTAKSTPRGAIDVNGVLFAAYDSSAVTIDASGTVTAIPGTLGGTSPVTWARNNKTPTPDVFCVSDVSAYLVTAGSITTYNAAGVLPASTSVSFLDGYAIFTIGDGRIFATGLNSTTVNALSFTTAESKADGLVRGVVSAGQFYAFGYYSFEVYSNVGTSPFPLQRVASVPVGLVGASAIAGFEDGWDLSLYFVPPDGTVRKVGDGYQPIVVSTREVQDDINALGDKTALRASVYVAGGVPFFVLSSPSWTWELNARVGTWNKRESFGSTRWLGGYTVYFQNRWRAHNVTNGKLLTLSDSTFLEDGAAMPMVLEGITKGFPNRLAIGAAYFDATLGQGNPLGSDEERDPRVTVQWSKNGGATWSSSNLQRALGAEGEFSGLLRVNRIGLSTHHGMRFRVTFAAPVHTVFRGGKLTLAETAGLRAP